MLRNTSFLFFSYFLLFLFCTLSQETISKYSCRVEWRYQYLLAVEAPYTRFPSPYFELPAHKTLHHISLWHYGIGCHNSATAVASWSEK